MSRFFNYSDDDDENRMVNEINVNTCFTFTKKDVVKNGMSHVFEAASESLCDKIEPEFLELILDDLKEIDNTYQFILTIKKSPYFVNIEL